MRRRPSVTVGITSQNGPLLYPYSPAYMASDRGGAGVTVSTMTAISEELGTGLDEGGDDGWDIERFGTVGVLMAGM